jgi:hypothetical protein
MAGIASKNYVPKVLKFGLIYPKIEFSKFKPKINQKKINV